MSSPPSKVIHSVAKRLKHYADIRRKEDGFDLSGVTRRPIEGPDIYASTLKAGRLAGWSVRRNFVSHWAEAVLLASLKSSGEESESTLQTSPERQQQVRQVIKEKMSTMDFTNSAKGSRNCRRRVKTASRFNQNTPRPASVVPVSRPQMTHKEFKRLILSASKIISAITQEATYEDRKRKRQPNGTCRIREAKPLIMQTDDVPNKGGPINGVGESKISSTPRQQKRFQPVTIPYEGSLAHGESDSESSTSVCSQDQTKESDGHTGRTTIRKLVEYEIIFHTGPTDGSSPPADVYLSLVGDYGRSEELLLSQSLTNSSPFNNGQTDIFKIEIEDIGQLQNCIIRLEKISHTFYLEDVIIKKLGNSSDLYVFPCKTLLSPDAEIMLQCPPEHRIDDDNPPSVSVDGSSLGSQSLSLPTSRTSSCSSSMPSAIKTSLWQQFGEESSLGDFNSWERPYSTPPLIHKKIQNFPKSSRQRQILHTGDLSDRKVQNSDLNSKGSRTPSGLIEVGKHFLKDSNNFINAKENSVVQNPNKALHRSKLEKYSALTSEDSTTTNTTIPPDNSRLQEISAESGQKNQLSEDLQIVNPTGSNAPYIEDGDSVNVILSNETLLTCHNDTQYEDTMPTVTCQIPLTLYNMLLDLARDSSSCSVLLDPRSTNNSLEHESTVGVVHPSDGSNESTETNQAEKCSTPTLAGSLNEKLTQIPLQQSNNGQSLVLQNSNTAPDVSINGVNVFSNLSADLASSDTEEFEFSISSSSSCLHSMNSQGLLEEMALLEEMKDHCDSGRSFHDPFSRALDFIKKNNCHQLEKLCHNNMSLLSSTDTEGRTLLHHAAAHGNVNICRVLLKDTIGKMQLDLQDMYGKTALHYAIQMHNSTVLKFLVKEEAKYDIPDNNSQTVLDLALCLIEWHVYWESEGGSPYPPFGWLPPL